MDLAKYYEEICKYPLLTREEERELFQKYKSPSTNRREKLKIKDKIIKSNLRFVFKTAKAYSKNHVEYFSELIEAGNEGLVDGFNKYNPENEKGVRFLSYAGWWVTQRILKEMSRMRIVSLPIWKQQLATRIQRVIDDQPNITLHEIKRIFSEEQEKDVEELFRTRYLTYYIEDMTDDPSFEINPIEEEVEKRIEKEELIKRVMALEEPYRSAIVFSFGLNDGTEVSNSAAAKKLKMKREEYKKIKEKALRMLRETYGGSLD